MDQCDTDSDGKLDFTEAVLTNRVDSDSTENIELGAKFSILDNRLTINTALFRVDWADLPVNVHNTSDACPGTTGIVNNLGEARSQGVEIEVNYLVTPELVLNLATSYMDTEITDAVPPLSKGDRLIYAPRTNANLGLQYNFDLEAFPVFVRTDISYVGEYETAPSVNAFSTGGDYVNVNLRAGLNMDQWSVAFYASNITNEDELLVFETANNARRVSPRRIGLEVSYDF